MKKTAALFLLAFINTTFAVYHPYPKNAIKLGYYNRSFIHVDCPRPPNPIFWSAMTKVKNGVQLDYQRLLYDNGGRFSIYIGADVSRYQSFDGHSFYTETVYPELRYWFIRSRYVDFYFVYSVAGPTILSRRVIAQQNRSGGITEKDLGGYFIFQDFMGLGVLMGHHHAISLDVRLMHYSNGDLLPKNPGFDVPIVVYLGYTF